MAKKMTKMASPERAAQIRAEMQRERAEREKSYRARALKLFPHICASCGREFEGPRLKELTVHHKDLNHEHNPPDGSNWELLCIYCHDNEHEKFHMAGRRPAAGLDLTASRMADPFAGLDTLLGTGSGEADPANPAERE